MHPGLRPTVLGCTLRVEVVESLSNEMHSPFFLLGTAQLLYFFFLINVLKSILFLAVLALHCCAWAFSSCGVQASLCGGFSFCRAPALGPQASVVVAHGLSCPTICGILVPRSGTERTSPALAGRFLTLDHQGNPPSCFSRWLTLFASSPAGQCVSD